MYVNLLWVLMLVNSIPFQCVTKCQQGFTHVGSSTQILKNSKLELIKIEHLKTWSCLISNHNAQNAQQKKIECFSVDGFCAHCNTVFEAMGCYFLFCPCQESRASLSEEVMQRGTRKREHDELRTDYLRNKEYNIADVWECKWWERVKEEENVRNHMRKNFPFKLPMKQETLLAKIRYGKMFGYV